MGDEARKTFGQFISHGSAGKVAENNAISALTGSDAPLSGMGRDEKAALKRAQKAEEAFRASKGYPPKTLWGRFKKRFLGK